MERFSPLVEVTIGGLEAGEPPADPTAEPIVGPSTGPVGEA